MSSGSTNRRLKGDRGRLSEEMIDRSGMKIESIRIRGFRSLREIELVELPNAVVLIGPNGSGKSNFIRFFEMLNKMIRYRRLNEFVQLQGGVDDQLFQGYKTTPILDAEVSVRMIAGVCDYKFKLDAASRENLVFTAEDFRYRYRDPPEGGGWKSLGSGHKEAKVVEAAQEYAAAELGTTQNDLNSATAITTLLRSCSVFQFSDTSRGSGFNVDCDMTDDTHMRSDGGNLAAILHRLQYTELRRFELICRHIARVLPVFDRFVIEEKYGKVSLRWKAKGSDKTIGAHLTSDGSLRFFALVTLLNLPDEVLPEVILLDEPELGLHPAAVDLIGDMIKLLSRKRQVFVATQSPLLVDAFELEEVVVLEFRNGATVANRFDEGQYRHWLEASYTVGDLWQKNLLGGRP